MKYLILMIILYPVIGFSQSQTYEEFKRDLPDLLKKEGFNSKEYEKKKVEELERYKNLALSGDNNGMYLLSKELQLNARAYNAPNLFKPAYYWLNESAKHGKVEALIDLGHIHKNGSAEYSVEIDLIKAASYFKAASNKGSSTAEFYYKDIMECELSEVKAEDC